MEYLSIQYWSENACLDSLKKNLLNYLSILKWSLYTYLRELDITESEYTDLQITIFKLSNLQPNICDLPHAPNLSFPWKNNSRIKGVFTVMIYWFFSHVNCIKLW